MVQVVPVSYIMVKNTVTGMLRQMEFAVSDTGLQAFMRNQVDTYLRQRADQRFRSEGDAAVGGTWDPLKESTEWFRRRQGFPAQHPINQRTGELREFVTKTPGSVAGVAGGFQLTLPGETPTGELYDKLATAQQGRGNPATEARPVLGIDMIDGVSIGVALIEYMFAGNARTTP